MSNMTLSFVQQIILFLASLLIVGFGQPAWTWWVGLIAAGIGFALFWRVLLDIENKRQRFLIAMIWFAGVQYIQFSWAISHPYIYIYIVYTFFALSIGIQFGILSLLITPSRINNTFQMIAIASIWSLLEWSRLFFLSGITWNPVGLALTGHIYPLQMASFWGVFGLSFWVIFVNLLGLKAWMKNFNFQSTSLFLVAFTLPFFYGFIHLQIHQKAIEDQSRGTLNAVLVQTAFPVDQVINYSDKKSVILHVMNQWKKIFHASKKQQGHQFDLLVLPEYAVSCGTYTCIFPYSIVKTALSDIFGTHILEKLPPLTTPFAHEYNTPQGSIHLVNNAYIVQALANIFDAGVIIGLEDADENSHSGGHNYYSAALFFKPWQQDMDPLNFSVDRYEKRILVPLGEYIPFAFCKAIAAEYGIHSSFTPGKAAKIFKTNRNIPFGVSICYEETFGDLMRENKVLGAELLVNLTSDAWYPNSRLPHQHFSHARLRSVENGIPLLRSSNIGITGAIDSLGRIVALIGEDIDSPEWIFDSLRVEVPLYTYATIYSKFGDKMVIAFCFIGSLFLFNFPFFRKKQ